MWDRTENCTTTKAMIPDRCYATMYRMIIEDARRTERSIRRPSGSVPNVGLMAQKAEEYGSHDKTFQAPGNGTIRAVDASGATLLEQKVEEGDIFRMCQAKDAPIRDWVKLAVNRARATGAPAVFWLDKNRAHDAQIIEKVEEVSEGPRHEGPRVPHPGAGRGDEVHAGAVPGGEGYDFRHRERVARLPDRPVPDLELGTSAKMLSIVPLLGGGGLFETGAGGSAPKHVQQFVKEGYLRWDSLGEFSALLASLEHLAERVKNEKALRPGGDA